MGSYSPKQSASGFKTDGAIRQLVTDLPCTVLEISDFLWLAAEGPCSMSQEIWLQR